LCTFTVTSNNFTNAADNTLTIDVGAIVASNIINNNTVLSDKRDGFAVDPYFW